LHPVGIEFGLSRGLLELQGEDVVASDRLLDVIAANAVIAIGHGGSPVASGVWPDTVGGAIISLLKDDSRLGHEDFSAFWDDASLAVIDKLMLLADRIGVGHLQGEDFKLDEAFSSEFSDRMFQHRAPKDRAEIQSKMFRVCHEIVCERFFHHDRGNIRYSLLITFFVFNFWNAFGKLSLLEDIVNGTYNPEAI
jgi:hypothetical protein